MFGFESPSTDSVFIGAAHRPFGFRTVRLSLRPIPRRIRQQTLMPEHESKIALTDPLAAGRAPDEMISLVPRRIA